MDLKTNDALKTCSYCGQPVEHGMGWITIGLCPEHSRIWKEDIESGFARNRLKEILIARGETSDR